MATNTTLVADQLVSLIPLCSLLWSISKQVAHSHTLTFIEIPLSCRWAVLEVINLEACCLRVGYFLLLTVLEMMHHFSTPSQGPRDSCPWHGYIFGLTSHSFLASQSVNPSYISTDGVRSINERWIQRRPWMKCVRACTAAVPALTTQVRSANDTM